MHVEDLHQKEDSGKKAVVAMQCLMLLNPHIKAEDLENEVSKLGAALATKLR